MSMISPTHSDLQPRKTNNTQTIVTHLGKDTAIPVASSRWLERSQRTTVNGYLLVVGDTLVNDKEVLLSLVQPVLVWEDRWTTELSKVYEKLMKNDTFIILSNRPGLNAIIKLGLLEDCNAKLPNQYYVQRRPC